MCDPGITTFSPSAGPAHQLHAIETFGGGEVRYLLQAKIRQNCTDKTENHCAVPPGRLTHRFSRALLRTASQAARCQISLPRVNGMVAGHEIRHDHCGRTENKKR